MARATPLETETSKTVSPNKKDLQRLALAYLTVLHTTSVLGTDDAKRDIQALAGQFSGIAKSLLAPSKNPRTNTVAQTLQAAAHEKYPEIDEKTLNGLLSLAFTTASRLCRPNDFQEPMSGKDRRKLEKNCGAAYAQIREISAKLSPSLET